MGQWIALIRAIGPKTHKLMSMADLRKAAEDAGLAEVRTVLATGNLLFASRRQAAALQERLEKVLTGFGLTLPENTVVLTTPAAIRTAMAEVPFPRAVTDRPSHLLYVATQTPPDAAARDRLAGWDKGPERLVPRGHGVWIDYPGGIGTSQLTPRRLETLLGQPGTGRNWNTLTKLVMDPPK